MASLVIERFISCDKRKASIELVAQFSVRHLCLVFVERYNFFCFFYKHISESLDCNDALCLFIELIMIIDNWLLRIRSATALGDFGLFSAAKIEFTHFFKF